MAKVAYLEDEGIKIARDLVKGTTWIHRQFNDSINSVESTIWVAGGLFVWPNTANTLNVASSSVNDTSGGTGARTLTIEGLDSNYDVISETITMNGESSITTTRSYLRLYRATVATAGSLETNAGAITLTHNGTAQPIGKLSIGSSQTQMSTYTIPRGKTGYLSKLDLTSSKSTDGYVTLRTRITGVSRVRHSAYMSGGSYSCVIPYPTVLAQYTDIELRGIALTGNGQITGNYDILIVDNQNLN